MTGRPLDDVRSVHLRGGTFYLVFFAALGVYLPFLNVYFHRLGMSGEQIGLLSAVLPAVILLTATPVTVLADRRSWHHRLLVAGTVGTIGGLIALAVPTAFWGVLFAMLLFAVSFSALPALSDTLVAGMAARRGLNFGDMRLWGSIGFAALSIASGAVWGRTGYRPMFLTAAALYLLSLWFIRRLERRPVVRGRERVSPRVIAGDPFLLVIMVSTFLVMAAYGMDATFSGIYMTSLGGTGLFVGLLFGLSAVFELPSMRYTGHIIHRLGGPGTLTLAYGLYAVTYGGFALARSPGVLLALCVTRGLAFGLFYAGTVRIINERTPPQWAATVQGVMNGVAFGLARLISAPFGGWIFDAYGAAAIYLVCFGASIAAVLVMGGGGLTGVGERAAPHADEPAALERRA